MQFALAFIVAVGAAPLSAPAKTKGATPLMRSSMRRHNLAARASFFNKNNENQDAAHTNGHHNYGPGHKFGAPVTSRIANRRPLTRVRADKEYEGKKLAELFAGNKKWSEDMMTTNRPLMEFLGGTQEPKLMWIGCADSRVPESMITGMNPGEIFTIRNVANQAQISDNAVNSAIQFGVLALGVEDIMVCGHYGCGGAKASLTNQDFGAPLEQWIGPIRDVYRTHREYLDGLPEADRLNALIELNTVEQCLNVLRTAPVQQKRAETAKQPGGPIPRVHAVVYDPATGLLKDMNVDTDKLFATYKDLYDLKIEA
eukprot:CAMPEP_0167786034 /NCGR_PEP_ID=MMETSP0111_2-20121227/8556_1 /TAXON_ID=91324 /ORGANISM="Lotharella globosa, Strain CCCM811" /LENGTH=312 /DNA_ID=CAMNT_0007677347 /DNA_START=53 /DNA_END=991 /DNA_ORIENTATION=+